MRMPWTCPNGYSDSRTLQPVVRNLNMFEAAPDWTVREWLNTDRPLSLQDFQGKVIVIEAFQMLCPGCVSHGLPLAQKIRDTFGADQVAVIGIHTVSSTTTSREANRHWRPSCTSIDTGSPSGSTCAMKGSGFPPPWATMKCRALPPSFSLTRRVGAGDSIWYGQ